MNTISAKIKKFFSKNRNNILFVVLFVGLLYIDNVFAVVWDSTTNWTTWQQTTEQDSTKIILWLNWFLNIVWAWLGLITGLVMKFLQPGWTSGSVLWLNDILKNIWVMISNIVYFVFAFLLIAIAFMNIIWKWENNYQMKTALPKLIVWIIIVPFTWFIVQFIVSLSTIFTASMISLPYDIFEWSDKQTILSKINLPTDCTIDLTSSWWTKCEWTWKALSEVLSWKDSIWWIIWFYSYWLINIDEITKLKSRNTWTIKTIFDLWLKAIVDLIFVRAYLILLRAIAMVLFTRWIYLWLYAMFSPIFWLMYFFGKSIPSWMKKLEILTIPKLIWLAFVPVYVAAALSFWFIFLISAWHSLSWIVSDTYSTDTSKSASNWEGSDIAWIKFKIIWWSNSTEINTALNVLTNAKDWAKDLVWQFIMQLFGIAILWMVVMAALQSSEITKSIVEPIAQFWWSIWKTITSLPKYAPIFPGWMSAESMRQVWAMPWDILNRSVNDKSNEFRDKFFWWAWKDIQEIKNDIKQLDKIDELKPLLKKYKKAVNDYWRNDTRVKEMEKELATQLQKHEWIFKDYVWGANLKDIIWKDWTINDEQLAKAVLAWWANQKIIDNNDITKFKNSMWQKWENFKDIKENKISETPEPKNNNTINVQNIQNMQWIEKKNWDTMIVNPDLFAKDIESKYSKWSIKKEELEKILTDAWLINDEKKIEETFKKLSSDFFKKEEPKK